jgi:hypothetical protein
VFVIVDGNGIFIVPASPNSIKHIAGVQMFRVSHSWLSVDGID